MLLLQVDILRDTVMGALNAALPIGTKRTIYLCDDLPGAFCRLRKNVPPNKACTLNYFRVAADLSGRFGRWMVV
jgi:hypothetical protein